VTRPLAADSFSDTIRFRAADEIARSPAFRLVASPGPVRLALYAPGRVDDGWLGLAGSFDLWPESVEEGLAGTLAFDLAGALGAPPVAVELRPPGAAPREVVVRSGQTRSVSVPVCADGPWSMEFVAPAPARSAATTSACRRPSPSTGPTSPPAASA
jgi:hypothetical protein